jgi:hypothetical protein
MATFLLPLATTSPVLENLEKFAADRSDIAS